MRTLTGFLLAIFLYGCNASIPFEFPENETLVYCNCLFSPNSEWSVFVGESFTFLNPQYNRGIDNAIVYIVAENNDTILLAHSGGGNYKAKGKKPVEGILYSLIVIAKGDTITSEPAGLPQGVSAEITGFVEESGRIKIDFGSLDNMSTVEYSLLMDEPKECGILIQHLNYDPSRNIQLYTFNNEVVDSLKKLIENVAVLDKLTTLIGDTINGWVEMDARMQLLFGNDLTYSDIEIIKNISICGHTNERLEHTMFRIDSFTDCNNFSNLFYFKEALVGKFYENTQFNVFVDGLYEGEYWSKLIVLGTEAHRYYDDYLKQLDSRVDMNSIQSKVYSNMSNGIGIFAGIKEKWIQIK
jgi:hypothetical protein